MESVVGVSLSMFAMLVPLHVADYVDLVMLIKHVAHQVATITNQLVWAADINVALEKQTMHILVVMIKSVVKIRCAANRNSQVGLLV